MKTGFKTKYLGRFKMAALFPCSHAAWNRNVYSYLCKTEQKLIQ